jgi:hypothetical protein
MAEDVKGKRFLELIDEQNNLQWSIISKLTALVKSEWTSENIKTELEELVKQHSDITKELNGLDEQSTIL